LEYDMSLPSGEQQILDGIAETLRASEPRLASMFAIFGRLVKNEGPPLRERLPAARPFARLAALRHRLSTMRGARARDSRRGETSSSGASLPGASYYGAGPRTGKPVWQLVFVFANVVAAVVIVAVLIALSAHSARTCTQRPSPSAPVFVFRGGNCPAQAGSGGSAPQR
jgi:hypothetical protein